ncbi:MAG: DUF3575 domain-containing protein [Bacteroidia bacterium]|nr:DUF3575 domain-containing protein [Bacteroidia bacterium]MCF8425267.1 DUF3575 domain-containing protein [Bacteroidia bacterium]MCF8446511.1 DUF3575 domain-containing protein [Bacteroidia bacterium]
MKKPILLFFFFISLSQLLAQTNKTLLLKEPPKNYALKVNVLSPFLASLNLSLETPISEKWSIQNGLVYTHLGIDENNTKPFVIKGFQYILDFRKYRKKNEKWNGSYHQYFARYSNFKNNYYIQDSSTQNKVVIYKENLSGISLGYVFGYQKTFRNKFLIDAFVGACLSFPTNYRSEPNKPVGKDLTGSFEINPYTNGFGIRTGIKVGYLF